MPGTFSKAFYATISHKSCHELVHPGYSCGQEFVGNLPGNFIGSFKFFFPVCVVPLVLNFNRIKEKKVWKLFCKNLLKCVTFGTILASGILSGFCCML